MPVKHIGKARQEENIPIPCAVCERMIKRPHYRWLTGADHDDLDLCGFCFFRAVRLRMDGRKLDLYIFLRLDEIETGHKSSAPLPDDVVIDMRYARANGMTVRAIADKYFLAPQRVSSITRGEYYRHVGGPIAD